MSGGITSGAMGVGFGMYNMIKGAKKVREATRALENYERQELENIADGLSVSTLGADLLREENARISASNIEALRGAGTRGIIGGSGRVSAETNRMNRDISADLDMQQKEIDQIEARDRAVIRNMQENREIGDINALSSQIVAGEEQRQAGFGQQIKGYSSIEEGVKSIVGMGAGGGGGMGGGMMGGMMGGGGGGMGAG